MNVEVEVHCLSCNHKWWMKAGEVKSDDMPACPKCFSGNNHTFFTRRARGATPKKKKATK